MSENVKNLIWILLASILIGVFFLMGGCANKTEAPTGQDQPPPASTSTALEDGEDGSLEDSGAIDDLGSSDTAKNDLTKNDSSKHDSQKSDSTKDDENKAEPIVEKTLICEISITCETLLANPDKLPPGKKELIPPNGIILAPTKVEFKKGESVFDILARATKNNGIHMEFVKTPLYNSAYIEGINNIYEFDGGEASGWMYSVNGVFPQRGASTYIVESNDRIRWVYSMDLGRDVGGYSVNQKDQ